MKNRIIATVVVLTTILSLQAQTTDTIYPTKDALLKFLANSSSTANTNYGNAIDLTSADMTSSGYSLRMKALMDFDLSGIPEGVVISSANLYLYGTGGHRSDLTEFMYYFPNTSKLSRVQTAWNENTVTWNSAASFTIANDNQATIPNSSSRSQNYVVDITGLVKDIKYSPSLDN